jgi:hypothetical protein
MNNPVHCWAGRSVTFEDQYEIRPISKPELRSWFGFRGQLAHLPVRQIHWISLTQHDLPQEGMETGRNIHGNHAKVTNMNQQVLSA